MNGLTGISSATEISHSPRPGSVGRTPDPSSVRTSASDGMQVPRPVGVPDLGATARVVGAMDRTEEVWRGFMAAAERGDRDGAAAWAGQSEFLGPVEWPDVPPRELPSGKPLLPLRTRLAEGLVPEDDGLTDVSRALEQARVEGVEPEPDQVVQGLQELSALRERFAVETGDAVERALQEGDEPVTFEDDAAAEAAARDLVASVARDPTGAVATQFEPTRVVELLD